MSHSEVNLGNPLHAGDEARKGVHPGFESRQISLEVQSRVSVVPSKEPMPSKFLFIFYFYKISLELTLGVCP